MSDGGRPSRATRSERVESRRAPRPRAPGKRREGLTRVAGLAAAFLTAFGALDVLVVRALHPGLGLALPLGLRACGVVVALIAYATARSPRVPRRVAEAAHALLLAVAAALMALFGAWLGGPTSPYVHGLSIAFIVRATVIPAPFRESLAVGALLLGVHAAVTVALYAVDPAAHAAWLTSPALVHLASSYAIVASVFLGGAYGSSAADRANTELRAARRIGRYRLEAPIGRGGQSEVWLAWDASLERQVALKLLDGDVATADARQLFEREAKLASQLESPHAVRVYDFGASDDGTAYLAMEYLPGEDLSTIVGSHGPLPPARAIHFAVQACRALEDAHAIGLVHRDVKPANLRVTKAGDAWDVLKLVDFGIARRRTPEPDHSTVAGRLRGTPAYMSPEACRGEPAAPAADVYSLGATLYHLVAGQPPFVGDDVEIVSAQLTAAVPPPSKRRGSEIPVDLERVVLRCLEKHPGDRYPSARALREALEACADAGRWSASDATAFWESDRPAAVARWDAETLA